MLEEHLRTWYQKYFVDKIASILAARCSANYLTISGLFLGILVPVFLDSGHIYTAIAVLLLSGYFDTLDGTVARFQAKCTTTGTVIDILSDRIVEIAIIIGLFFIAPNSRGFTCILMLSSMLLCITSFLVVGIFSDNDGKKSFNYSPGLMERAEAFIFFIAMILFPHLFTALALAFTILVIWTAVVRIYKFISNNDLTVME